MRYPKTIGHRKAVSIQGDNLCSVFHMFKKNISAFVLHSALVPRVLFNLSNMTFAWQCGGGFVCLSGGVVRYPPEGLRAKGGVARYPRLLLCFIAIASTQLLAR